MPKDLNLQLSRLDTLRASYRGHQAAETDYWTPTYVQTEVDVGLFRANNAYIYQFHNSWQSYAWSVANVKSRSNAVFDLLHETGDYGAEVHFVDGKAVGRDLLDSAAELQFILDSVRPARRLRILDIGAGYGRLAHRAFQAGLDFDVVSTDAIPESTWLCEAYLARMGVPSAVVPLNEIEAYLKQHTIDLATNIHSFPECSLRAIQWWVNLLVSHDVPWLMIVPNELGDLRASGPGRERPSFANILKERGYELVRRRLKYVDPYRKGCDWVFQDEHLLFRLRGSSETLSSPLLCAMDLEPPTDSDVTPPT